MPEFPGERSNVIQRLVAGPSASRSAASARNGFRHHRLHLKPDQHPQLSHVLPIAHLALCAPHSTSPPPHCSTPVLLPPQPHGNLLFCAVAPPRPLSNISTRRSSRRRVGVARRAARAYDVPVLRRRAGARSSRAAARTTRSTWFFPSAAASRAPTRSGGSRRRRPSLARAVRPSASSATFGDEDRFLYSETPPSPSRTLEGFLLYARQGYCQHYSGAMALLLRMAGIPARVVTGLLDRRDGRESRRVHCARLRRPLLGRGRLPRLGLAPARPDAGRLARPQPARRRRPSPAARAPLAAASATRGRPRRRRPVAGDSALVGYPLIVARRLPSSPCSPSASRRSQRRAARALRARARPPPHPPRPAPGTTLHALELRFSATPASALYLLALPESPYRDALFHPPDARAAPRAAGRARPRRRGARPPPRLVGAAAPLASPPAGLQLSGWTMSMTSISEEWRCWRTGTSTRRRSRWPRPAT